jgi:ubiquitin-like 1-activating enzyme E1 A
MTFKEAPHDPPQRDESDVYDRQIRLWGRDAQLKMSQTRVLYIHMTGISCEVGKNLALAGVKVTLCDNRPFPSAMAETPCFLLQGERMSADVKDEPDHKKAKLEPQTVAQAMKPLIEELNPLLGECEIVDYQDLNQQVLSRYGIVISSRMENMQDACRIAEQTTSAGGKFFMADCFGMSGACIIDLGANHRYRPEKGKELLDEVELASHVPFQTIINEVKLQDAKNRFHKQPPDVWIQYRSILEFAKQTGSFPHDPTEFAETIVPWIEASSPLLASHKLLSKESLAKLAKVAQADVAPVCAVLGGLIGNEVIKAISGKGEPVNNTLLFDGATCKGFSFLVQTKQ